MLIDISSLDADSDVYKDACAMGCHFKKLCNSLSTVQTSTSFEKAKVLT